MLCFEMLRAKMSTYAESGVVDKLCEISVLHCSHDMATVAISWLHWLENGVVDENIENDKYVSNTFIFKRNHYERSRCVRTTILFRFGSDGGPSPPPHFNCSSNHRNTSSTFVNVPPARMAVNFASVTVARRRGFLGTCTAIPSIDSRDRLRMFCQYS